MAIFLGKTNSGDQNFLNPLIYHRDTSLYMDLKLFGATPSGRFASILSNLPVKSNYRKKFVLLPQNYKNGTGVTFQLYVSEISVS